MRSQKRKDGNPKADRKTHLVADKLLLERLLASWPWPVGFSIPIPGHSSKLAIWKHPPKWPTSFATPVLSLITVGFGS